MHTKIHNENGIGFTVRIVMKGEKYGLDMRLTHEEPDPLVEFYDTRYKEAVDPDGTELGQFVSRYYLSTLSRPEGIPKRSIFESGKGLNLDAGIKDWTVDGLAMEELEIFLFDQGLVDDLKSPGLVRGFLPFWSDSVDKSIDPYPSYMPRGTEADTAEGWAELYCVSQNRVALEDQAREDCEEVEWDKEEADVIFPVVITRTGEMRVYHEGPRYVLAAHSAEEVLRAHELVKETQEPGF